MSEPVKRYSTVLLGTDMPVSVVDARDYDRDVQALRDELSALKNSMAYRTSMVGRLEQARDTLAAENARLREALAYARNEAFYGLRHARSIIQASAALGRIAGNTDAAIQPNPGQKEGE